MGGAGRAAGAISSSSRRAPLWRHDDAPIRIGVSTCLLGQPVRWDGGHKRDPFLMDELGPFVEWVPVCPEVEIGMGTPRETVHLARDGEGVRLVAHKSGADWTERMHTFARRRVRELERLELCGYVLKKNSPTCGLERVPVRNPKGMPEKNGRGVFADVLVTASPTLPVEEEGRLHDPRLRENWIERVFAYRRLRSFFAERWTLGSLVRFHTAHKLQLMAHSPRHYAELGRVVAEAKAAPRGALRERYEAGFMDALRHLATPRRHVNVLQHVLGHFRDRLDAADRRELAALVDDYGRGLLPLVVPITLVRHHVQRAGVDYLAGQVYLEPHPKELMLRNRV
ncbi:MAG: DUF1722 domain-containing protein [Proteobacteria bacterium]|nr:MAG: DUF1722 domain-containing protein [Pseudomonadota bacterium]